MVPCLVCGATPTVASHVFPRALMHDVKGADNHIHEISFQRRGTKFLQSGLIDKNILCQNHEASTQKFDDYAVRFCRRVRNTIGQSNITKPVENPNPHHLGVFAMSTVWRFCASQAGRGLNALGSYQQMMLDGIFRGSECTLPLTIARNHLKMPDGSESTLVIAPFPMRMNQWRAWFFAIGGVHFYLKLDARPFPPEFDSYLANVANPVQLVGLPEMQALNVPMLQPIMAQMIQPTRNGKR